jgi:uncharacterized membrane protein (UPF0127 family)
VLQRISVRGLMTKKENKGNMGVLFAKHEEKEEIESFQSRNFEMKIIHIKLKSPRIRVKSILKET